MISIAIRVVKFVAAFVCCTIACTIAWEYLVKDRLYNCTDDLPFDYLQPGQWVHQPATVPHVVRAHSMSEPDTIKQGWNITRLWYLWFSVIGGSLALSTLLAWMPWIPRKPSCEICQLSHAT